MPLQHALQCQKLGVVAPWLELGLALVLACEVGQQALERERERERERELELELELVAAYHQKLHLAASTKSPQP